MLSQSTVRIEGYSDTIIGGQKRWFTHTGTGFFYEFEIDSIKFPVIVTNRHVVEKSKNGKFAFRFVDSTYKLGLRIRSGTLEIMSFNKSWIYHPTEDLAILPLGPIKEAFFKKYQKKISSVSFVKELIPSIKDSIQISSIEKVVMVGYPKGLWDSTNNYSIVRQGLTATPFYLDFNGQKRFLIDIPTFQGSSGSPVILYSFDPYWKDERTLMNEFRTYLLGIAVEAYNYNAKGSIVPDNIYPNLNDSISKRYRSETTIPFNIAVVIKAERLFDFHPLIRNYLKSHK